MASENRSRFNTILVAVDLSQAESGALDYAQEIARRHQSTLVVVYAIDPVSYAFPEGVPDWAAVDRAAREGLRRIEEETRQQGIPVRSVVETGVVYERILQAALDHRADLLVLGSRAESHIGRAALGTVARRLISKACCPVLTVPPDVDPGFAGSWHRVLAATDFSPASLAALELAQSIADGQLAVLHAACNATRQECEHDVRLLLSLVPNGAATSRLVEEIVAPGQGAEVVAEQARALNADLVVVGSPLNELRDEDFSSSTILQVISNVNCPVLCVPASEFARQPGVARELVCCS